MAGIEVEPDEAAPLVASIDARDNATSAERRLELDGLLDDDLVGFSGLAAEWLFADGKADSMVHVSHG